MLICLLGRKSRVRVSQVVIPDIQDYPSEFDQVWQRKIDLLKASQQCENKNQRFGFQISCCGRGSNYHQGQENYESSLFLKSFPGVSLTGFFANGEIGNDYLFENGQEDTNSTNNLTKQENNSNELDFLTFSSVFTIVSIKI